MKITEVNLHRLRVLENVGELELAWSPGSKLMFQKGGGSFVELLTDEGHVGIGPEVDDRFLPTIREYLIGKDPFDVELHSGCSSVRPSSLVSNDFEIVPAPP